MINSDSTEIVRLECPGGTFTAHAVLLAHHSQYFRRVLNSEPEGENIVIKFTESYSIDTVRFFIDWIYIRSSGKREECHRKIGSTSRSWKSYFQCWAFGDLIAARSFQNDMVRYMMQNENILACIWIDGMSDVWDDIPYDSALESLALNLLCRDLLKLNQTSMMKRLDELPDWISRKVSSLLLSSLRRVNTEEGDSLVNDGNKYSWNIGNWEKYQVEEEDEDTDDDDYVIEEESDYTTDEDFPGFDEDIPDVE